ncbi:hypothetical protein [Corynebacterium kalidii]
MKRASGRPPTDQPDPRIVDAILPLLRMLRDESPVPASVLAGWTQTTKQAALVLHALDYLQMDPDTGITMTRLGSTAAHLFASADSVCVERLLAFTEHNGGRVSVAQAPRTGGFLDHSDHREVATLLEQTSSRLTRHRTELLRQLTTMSDAAFVDTLKRLVTRYVPGDVDRDSATVVGVDGDTVDIVVERTDPATRRHFFRTVRPSGRPLIRTRDTQICAQHARDLGCDDAYILTTGGFTPGAGADNSGGMGPAHLIDGRRLTSMLTFYDISPVHDPSGSG